MKLIKRHKPTHTQIIVLMFLTVILIGSFLLTLPVSAKARGWTSPLDAVFTATSATCVTGLVVFDTYSHWSVFGQVVILCLIQIGGIGFMSIVSIFSLFLRRKIGLNERQLLAQSSGMLHLGGIVRILKKIALGTLLFEGIGTVLLSFRFCPHMGFLSGIYNALFHSVSAFCNAGFDLMGKFGNYSSLTTFANDPVVCLTITALIIVGGLGFLVWNDVNQHKLHFHRYTLHTKIVLTVTGALLIIAFLGFLLMEFNRSMDGMSMPEKLMNALFQAATPRTAGFNTMDQAQLSEPGKMLTMLLMFIGGSPGSTAGGIKTTTMLVLILSAMTLSRRKQHVALFRRRLTDDTVRNANAIFAVYIGIVLAAVCLIGVVEPFSLFDIMYEVISAICTVGLTTGITPALGPFSRVIVALLMFVGRVGLTTLVMALHGKRQENAQERIPEKIIIG